jgi:hypothetical protein
MCDTLKHFSGTFFVILILQAVAARLHNELHMLGFLGARRTPPSYQLNQYERHRPLREY